MARTPSSNKSPTATTARRRSGRSAAASASADLLRSEKDNWDSRLGFLMHDVSRLRRAVFDDFMRPLGLTRSQWWVLAYLSRQDGMIQSDVANVLELGKAALGGLIDRLESSGFIERRSDDSDRRVKRVFLSAKGNRVVKDMLIQSHQMSERILDGLSNDDRHALHQMMLQVKANLLAIKRERAAGGSGMDAEDDTDEAAAVDLAD